jgi:hypothetical protein
VAEGLTLEVDVCDCGFGKLALADCKCDGGVSFSRFRHHAGYDEQQEVLERYVCYWSEGGLMPINGRFMDL